MPSYTAEEESLRKAYKALKKAREEKADRERRIAEEDTENKRRAALAFQEEQKRKQEERQKQKQAEMEGASEAKRQKLQTEEQPDDDDLFISQADIKVANPRPVYDNPSGSNNTNHNNHGGNSGPRRRQNIEPGGDLLNKKGPTVFLGGLTPDVHELDIRGEFSKFGEITDVRIMHGKGFGFVSFATEEGSDAALKATNVQIGGAPIRINPARGVPKRMHHQLDLQNMGQAYTPGDAAQTPMPYTPMSMMAASPFAALRPRTTFVTNDGGTYTMGSDNPNSPGFDTSLNPNSPSLPYGGRFRAGLGSEQRSSSTNEEAE